MHDFVVETQRCMMGLCLLYAFLEGTDPKGWKPKTSHTQPFAGRNQSSSSRKQADRRLYGWKNGNPCTSPTHQALVWSLRSRSLELSAAHVAAECSSPPAEEEEEEEENNQTLISNG